MRAAMALRAGWPSKSTRFTVSTIGISTPFPRSELTSALRCDNTFCYGFRLPENFVQLPALTQLESDRPVSAQRSRTRQHQVTQSREAGKRALLRAQSDSESRHLGETTRDERRSGVEAEPQPFGDTGGDGHHVLERAPELDTRDIGMSVRPEVRGAECALCESCCTRAFGRNDNRGWLALHDLRGKARPGKGDDSGSGNFLLRNLGHQR